MIGERPATVDPDRLAELEEERRFLLRSLADLEREHRAGDVDDVDYAELKDGYTVRAAATLRAIEDGRRALPAAPAPDWRRRAIAAVVVVILIGVVWWALAASSAQRLPGQQVSGLDPRDEVQVMLSQARALQLRDPAAAAEIYAAVLAEEPLDVEALTYRGWTLALSSVGETDPQAVGERLGTAVDSLLLAIETDPAYPDPYCLLGIVQYRFVGDATAALPLIEGCLAADPPSDIRGLVESLRDQVAADAASGAVPPAEPATGADPAG